MRWLLWGSSAIVLLRILAFAAAGRQAIAWDSWRLAEENAVLRACLASGNFPPCEGAGHFPLFQHLIALVLGTAGLGSPATARALALLSAAAFAATLVLGWRALSKPSLPHGLRSLWVVVLGTGPLLYYAQSSFGEMLAALLTLIALLACLDRWKALPTVAAFALAGITKEVAFPFLGALALLVVFLRGEARGAAKRRILAVSAGLGIAILLSAGFNLVRFGVPYNAIHLAPAVPRVGLADQLSFFGGLWLSPNGGLLFFWTSFVAVLAWSAGGRKLPWLGVAAILFGLTLGFSRWWAPFGWLAWGPRLMMPWIPALLLLLLRSYPELGRIRLPAMAVAAVAFLGLTQLGSLFGFGVMEAVFSSTPGCPRLATSDEPAYYFSCMRTYVWEPRIAVSELLRSTLRPPATFFALAYLAAVVAWCRELGRARNQ